MPRRSRQGQQLLRLFLALYPPPGVTNLLLSKLRAIPSLPPHREVPPDQIHLTLHFIGNTKARNLDATIESIDRAKKGIHQFDLTIHTLIAYPRPRTSSTTDPPLQTNPSIAPQRESIPRLLAAETDAPPDLLHLHERLVKRLTPRPPRANPNDRFHPHLTLCRFRNYRPADYDFHALNWATKGCSLDKNKNGLTFTATSFALLKSTLHTSGPSHDKIAEWPLSPTH